MQGSRLIVGLVAALGALLAAAPLALAAPPPTARESFDRGRTAFGRAEYQRAIDILHPLLYPDVVLDSEGEIVQAHRMLGVAYLFANRPEEAKREFRKLLELRPDFRFDPLLDPQRVVDFFSAVVKEEETTIAAIEARRRQRDQELAARRQREAERVRLPPPVIIRYERHSYAVNFIPFGAGQFQNGHRRKGWMFLGVQSTLAAISVGAFVSNFALYGIEPRRGCKQEQPIDPSGLPIACPKESIDHTEEETSNRLLQVQLVSGGLFFAAAIWGIVDAIRHYERDVLLSDGDGTRRSPPAGPRLTIMPGGLGAAWAF